MKGYFEKTTLDIDNSKICLEENKGKELFNYNGIAYYDVKDKSYLNSIFLIPPERMFIVHTTTQLHPHIDAGPPRGCLNYYIQPQLFKTTFWNPIENARRLKHKRYYKDTDEYKEVDIGYVKEDLIPVGSFVAEPYDTYFLNIAAIHSVEFLDLSKRLIPRVMLQFQWNATFDELLKMNIK